MDDIFCRFTNFFFRTSKFMHSLYKTSFSFCGFAPGPHWRNSVPRPPIPPFHNLNTRVTPLYRRLFDGVYARQLLTMEPRIKAPSTCCFYHIGYAPLRKFAHLWIILWPFLVLLLWFRRVLVMLIKTLLDQRKGTSCQQKHATRTASTCYKVSHPFLPPSGPHNAP